MASDRTYAKAELWMLQADPMTLLPCPTCRRAMAASETILRHAIGTGRARWDYIDVAEASHTHASADGGRTVALECAACNHARGNEPWNVTPDTVTVREGKRRAGEVARGKIRDTDEVLRGGG